MSHVMARPVPSASDRFPNVPALNWGAHIIVSLLVALLGGMTLQALEADALSNEFAFVFLTLVILGYSWVQAFGVHRSQGRRIFMNPTVFYAVIANGLMLGMGGLFYLLPDDIQVMQGTNEISYWMNYYLAVMILANIGLWSGYRSRIAVVLGQFIAQSRFFGKVIRTRYELRFSAIVILLAISLVARMITIGAGVFGYSATLEGMIQSSEYRQYLSIASQAGVFALMAVALDHFSQTRPPPFSPWLIGVVLFEAFFGLIGGFKSAVVMPFLIVIAVAYLLRGRIMITWVAMALVALALAYMFIEPFRQYRNEEYAFKSESLSYITEAAVSARGTVELAEVQGWRSNLSHFLKTQGNIDVYAEGLRYRDEVHGIPPGSPDFLLDILRSPLLAVIPRVAWQDKPELLIGGWYRVHVLQGPEGTSVGMSPVTYLYFAGGVIAVFLGFFAFGVVQSAIFHGFLVYGAGGALVFLGLFSFMRNPDSVYYTYIIDLIRMLPLLLAAQYLTLMPQQRS